MDNRIKIDCRNYIKNIRKSLVCNFSLKRVFLTDFKHKVYDFIALNPNATIVDLEQKFGNANEIANSFGDIITKELKRKARIYKILIIIIFIICIALITALTILLLGYEDRTVVTNPY